MKWHQSSLKNLLLALLWLNLLDIVVTIPAYEANPFTLYLWGSIGVFLSAWIKIGLVLFLGVLCMCARKLATPVEWELSRRILSGILIVLVAFYIFVVTWNTVLFVSVNSQILF